MASGPVDISAHVHSAAGSTPADGLETTPQRKLTRSRSGCATCRARKVKCDTRPGGCTNCERLGLECRPSGANHASTGVQVTVNGEPAGSQEDLTQAGTKRKRTYRSCLECRSSKARCSGEQPACNRCARRALQCKYDLKSKPLWTRALESDGSSPIALRQGGEPSKGAHSRAHSGSRCGDSDGHSADCMPTDERTRTTEHQAGRPQTSRPATAPQSPILDPGVRTKLDWLTAPDLPSQEQVRTLVKAYFDNVHPLRCFAFIHRPSFMQRLDESLLAEGTGCLLLQIVCALGAKFYALEYSTTNTKLPHRFILSAGTKWARKVQTTVLSDPGKISIEILMVIMLLHEHELRLGNYASSFILTGVVGRMAQALQVNLEYSTNVLEDEPGDGPSITAKESRRRLMWSCYVQDVMIASGVDQLTLFDDQDVKIQLPCTERGFLLGIPCVTEKLDEGHLLKFVPLEQILGQPRDNMGMLAFYVRLVRLRKRILRYVKHLDNNPWMHDSEFNSLDTAMYQWYKTLPASLSFTRSAMYMRKDSSQLGAFVLLQCTFHHTLCDLYRIGLPRLYGLDIDYSRARKFELRIRDCLFDQARNVTRALREAASHGVMMLADTWFSSIAFDNTKIMVYYITQIIDLKSGEGRARLLETLPLIQSNIEVLDAMQSVCAMAETLYNAAVLMRSKSGLFPQEAAREAQHASNVPDMTDSYQPEKPGSPDQSAPDYELQPTAIYRLARNSVPERHAAGSVSSPSATHQSTRSCSGQTPRSEHSYSTPANLTPENVLAPFPRSGLTPGANSAIGQMQPLTADEIAAFGIQGAEFDIASFNSDLEALFRTNFEGGWQPAETATAAVEGAGLPPWAGFDI